MARRSGRLVPLAALLAGATPLVWLASASAQSLPAPVVERLRSAVVFVGSYEPGTDRLLASGSGFLVSPEGEIVTARHVATQPGQLRVILRSGQPDERRLDATIAALDRHADLALLRVEAAGAPFLEIGDSERLRETDAVATASFPLGMQLRTDLLGPAPSFRPGRVSSMRRSRHGSLVWLETTDGGERGSSGGPLVDQRGAVVGIVVQGGGRATVLAIPSRRLVSFAGERLRLQPEDGDRLRAWLDDPLEQAAVEVDRGEYPRASELLRPFLRNEAPARRLLELHAATREGLGDREGALAAYRRLLARHPNDPRAGFWNERLAALERTRGDGDPRTNLLICAPQRREALVVDAGEGRLLETVAAHCFPYTLLRPDGRFAYARSETAVVGVDLVVPQAPAYMRRDYAALGTTDWLSASADRSVVALGISPVIQPTPRGSVVVLRGPELREAAVYHFDQFFSGGSVSPDGRHAYVTAVLRRDEQPRRVSVQRLDLETGELAPLVAETPFLAWIALPAGVETGYGLRPDGTVVRLDLRTGAVRPSAAPEVNDIFPGPAPGQLLFVLDELLVWDAAEDRELRRLPLPFAAHEVGITPGGSHYYVSDEQRQRLALLDPETGALRELRLDRGLPAAPGAAALARTRAATPKLPGGLR